jgi:O-antigen ligase
VTGTFDRLLLAALAWGAFSFGAVYPWAYWPLAALCAFLGGRWILVSRAWSDRRLRNLGLACAAVALAIAAQTVALPYSLVQQLSPALDAFFREYALTYHPASLHALSLSASSTLTALGLFVAFAMLVLGLTNVLAAERLEWLVNQLMGLGLALAVVGVVQKALIDPDAPLIYGFWKPRFGGNPFGPFINRNHFAGWMVMALPVIVGYSCTVLARSTLPLRGPLAAKLRWVMTMDASQFLLVGFCTLLMGMSLVLTGSRSGIASFVVAMMVFGYLLVRRFQERRARLLAAGYLTLVLAGAVAWAGTDIAFGRFVQARADTPGRFLAWQDTVRIIQDFPWFGIGMGTYGQAMLVYQTANRPQMYVQAHNDYLQMAAEGGLLVAVPVLVTAVLIVATIRRRLISGMDDLPTSWLRSGAIAGLAGIAAQSLVEFSLQMPGNTVLFACVLAIAMHRPAEGRARTSRRPSPNPHAYRI